MPTNDGVNGGCKYSDRIGRVHAGMTALDYYCLRHKHFSREQWLEKFAEGRITCGGLALSPDAKLAAGSALEYFRPPWKEPEVTTDIPILYGDAHVVVFDKPDSMPVLPGGKYLDNSLVRIARRNIDPRLSPLHRLGRGTTGAVLFTRTRRAAAEFSRMMREGSIRKSYLAIVRGLDMSDRFTISAPIGRVPHARLGEIHHVNRDGKPALTHCAVLARRRDNGTALLEIRIRTGRTHQIRIHLASLGCPLLGDAFYTGPYDARRAGSEAHASIALPGDAGYILHAWKLSYEDPFTGRTMEVRAPVRREIAEWESKSNVSIVSS